MQVLRRTQMQMGLFRRFRLDAFQQARLTKAYSPHAQHAEQIPPHTKRTCTFRPSRGGGGAGGDGVGMVVTLV